MQPGEKPPELSSYSHGHDAAGALGFATYYMKAFDWGIATTDPYLVAQISSPSCRACSRYIDGLTALRARDAHVEGGRTTLVSGSLVHGTFTVKSDFVVEFKLHEDPVVVVAPESAPSTTAAASTSSSLVFVSWTQSGWIVNEEAAP